MGPLQAAKEKQARSTHQSSILSLNDRRPGPKHRFPDIEYKDNVDIRTLFLGEESAASSEECKLGGVGRVYS